MVPSTDARRRLTVRPRSLRTGALALVAGLAAVAVVAPPAAAQEAERPLASDEDVDAALVDVRFLQDAGEVAAAEKLLRQIRAAQPQRLDVQDLLARSISAQALADAARLDDAIAANEALLQARPNHLDATGRLAVLLGTKAATADAGAAKPLRDRARKLVIEAAPRGLRALHLVRAHPDALGWLASDGAFVKAAIKAAGGGAVKVDADARDPFTPLASGGSGNGGGVAPVAAGPSRPAGLDRVAGALRRCEAFRAGGFWGEATVWLDLARSAHAELQSAGVPRRWKKELTALGGSLQAHADALAPAAILIAARAALADLEAAAEADDAAAILRHRNRLERALVVLAADEEHAAEVAEIVGQAPGLRPVAAADGGSGDGGAEATPTGTPFERAFERVQGQVSVQGVVTATAGGTARAVINGLAAREGGPVSVVDGSGTARVLAGVTVVKIERTRVRFEFVHAGSGEKKAFERAVPAR